MGKNFKTTIRKFIQRTPLRHCLPNPSSPQINDEDAQEDVPMKGKNKSTNLNDVKNSTFPNTTMTTTSFVTQHSTEPGLSDNMKQKCNALIEMNNPDIAYATMDNVQDDNQTNGVGSVRPGPSDLPNCS